MCIIAVKEKGIAPLSKEVLKNMFERNPDGAGVAVARDGILTIKKGLMNFEDFYKVCEEIKASDVVIYHCRIQTSGGVVKELTHPFLLNADIKQQRKTNIKTKQGEAVAHNGVFSGFGTKELNNDTTQFITTYLAPLKEIEEEAGGSILDSKLKPIINALVSGSKLAILDARGVVKRYGTGWTEEAGIFYSNETYKTPKWTYYYGKSYEWTKADERRVENNNRILKEYSVTWQELWKLVDTDAEFKKIYEEERDYYTLPQIYEYYILGYYDYDLWEAQAKKDNKKKSKTSTGKITTIKGKK